MENMKLKPIYDSIILLDSIPVSIFDDSGKEILIFGILYNKAEAHADDLFLGFLTNRYISYLRSSEIIQYKGGKLSPDEWEFDNGKRVSLNLSLKNLIYRIMRKDRLWYRLVERTEPIDIREGEVDENFLISTKPLERMGIDYEFRKQESGNHRSSNKKPKTKRDIEGWRTKVSEIVSSFDYYNRIGEYMDRDTLDICTNFTTPPEHTLSVDNGIVDIIKEMLEQDGKTDVSTPLQQPLTTKYEREYIMTFEEYIKENNYDKSSTKNCLGKLNDCTVREDDLDDFADDEEE